MTVRNGVLEPLGLLCLVLGAASVTAQAAARPEASRVAEGLQRGALATCESLAVERRVHCQPLGIRRQELAEGIGYHTLTLKVGPGEHDVIAVHRVVAERRPGHAKRADRAVLMIHGDIAGFEAAFLGLTLDGQPPRDALPVFLARHGVDVWGISFRWAQVPAGFPDQSFMAGWGMDTAIADARIALRIARLVRMATGHGKRRIHVLGWSRGVWATMALANAEATEPRHKRDIGGLVPVDGTYKLTPDHDAFRQSFCSDYALYQDWLAAGMFGVDYGLQAIGQLAIDAPDDPSPIAPWFTNAQLAMGAGSWPADIPGFEWYHGVAGTFDGDTPTGLVYTDPRVWFGFLSKVFGYDPVPYLADSSAVTCDELDVPWDDQLAEVRVPMLYVGAAGGFGGLGTYLTQIVGSPDVEVHLVSNQPPELAALDIGHDDIFQAPVSRELFWERILAWLKTH